MKELKDLTDAEKSVLIVSYFKLDKSLSCHQPKQKIFKGITNIKPNLRNRAFKSLVSNGFLREHPTKGNTTYNLPLKGLKAANQHIRDNFNNL